MPEATRILLPDLDKADALEVREYVGAGDVAVEERPTPPGQFGELVLATVAVTVTVAAIKGLIRYFGDKHRGKSFEEQLELELPDGTRMRWKLRYDERQGEAPAVALAKQLAEATGVAADVVLQGL